MTLDELLSVSEDEKTVLILAEEHGVECGKATLELLEAFQPDAIGVELSATQRAMEVIELFRDLNVAEDILVPGVREQLKPVYENFSSMVTSRVYGVKNELPLYYLDWYPRCPIHQEDMYASQHTPLPYPKMSAAMKSTIDALFGVAGHVTAMSQTLSLSHDELADVVKNINVEPEDMKGLFEYMRLRFSGYGMAMRNEYSARGLNSLSENRIAYVCGKEHVVPSLDLLSIGSFTPLNQLVDAPHVFVADMIPGSEGKGIYQMPGMTETIPRRCHIRKPLQLDWSQLSYSCEKCPR